MKRIIALSLCLALLLILACPTLAAVPTLTLSAVQRVEQDQTVTFTLAGGNGYASFTAYLQDNGKIKWDRSGMTYDNAKGLYRLTVPLDTNGCAVLTGKARYVGLAEIALVEAYLTDASGHDQPVDTVSCTVSVEYKATPIYTKEELVNIRNDLSGHYRLMADLTFTDEDYAPGGLCYNGGDGFAPIGYCLKYTFTGSFDGNCHTISGLRVMAAGWDYIGLFGVNAGTIRDLALTDVSIDASIGYYTISEARTITGKINYEDHSVWTVPTGMVDDSDLSAYDRTGISSAKVGGVCGYNRGTVENCCVYGTVTASNMAGGVVGNNVGAVIGCMSAASVTCGVAGGVLGVNNTKGLLSDCYATGTVCGDSIGGGLVGMTCASTQKNAYATGSVSGTVKGAVIGQDGTTVNEDLYYKENGTDDPKATSLTQEGLDALQFGGNRWETATGGPRLVWMNALQRTVTGLAWATQPAKTTYLEGKDALDVTGGVLRVTYSDGGSNTIPLTAGLVSGFDNTKVGEQILTVTLDAVTITYTITVNAKSLTKLEWVTRPAVTEYSQCKDELDVTGGTIRLLYDNGTNETKTLTAAMVSGFDNTLAGAVTLTVTYADKTLTYEVTVAPRVLDHITLDAPDKVIYQTGEALDVTGGAIRLQYDNGTQQTVQLTADLVTGFDSRLSGEQILTVTWETKTAAFTVTVKEPALPGDANADGILDTGDLVDLKKLLAGLIDEEDVPFADVDKNGEIDTGDLSILKKVLAGLLTL